MGLPKMSFRGASFRVGRSVHARGNMYHGRPLMHQEMLKLSRRWQQ